MTLLAGLLVVGGIVFVAETSRGDADRHRRAQVLVEQIRTAGQKLNTISSRALAEKLAAPSESPAVPPKTIASGYAAFEELNSSLTELRELVPSPETDRLFKESLALQVVGLGALRVAMASDLSRAMAFEERRFRPALERLNGEAERAATHQRAVAGRTFRRARIGFVGALVIGLATLMLLGYRFQRVRSAVALAGELRDIERRSEERLRALVEHSTDVVTVVDSDLRIKWQAASLKQVLGYEPSQLIGGPITAIVHPEDVALLDKFLLARVANPGSARVTARLRHAAGEWRDVEAVAENRMDDPAVEGVVLSMRDISERKRLEDELRYQAFHDGLTGLANRALFEDRLGQALAGSRRDDHGFAVLFLDIDDFKTINDRLGHVAGDDMLRAVGQRIAGVLRPTDTAARLGGDEFAVLVEPIASAEEAEKLAARMLAELAPPFGIAGRQLRVTGSIGVAMGRKALDVNRLLRNADTAMYAAKADGKATVRVFEQGMHRRVLNRLELVGELRRAVEEGEFQLDYQPIVELDSGRIVGVEALVRWPHPELGLQRPGRFITLAEETGMIVPLGLWILRTACAQAREWQLELPGRADLAVSVNVSTLQLQEKGFAGDVAAVLEITDLPPATLILEITESLFQADHEAIMLQLEGLKRLGLRIAVDDFGTGYSALSYLHRLPADMLKIDRSFVAGIDGDSGQAELVRGIVNLGERLHLDAIAEGIEQLDEAAKCRAMRVPLGQGFLFSPPVPGPELHDLLVGDVQRAESIVG